MAKKKNNILIVGIFLILLLVVLVIGVYFLVNSVILSQSIIPKLELNQKVYLTRKPCTEWKRAEENRGRIIGNEWFVSSRKKREIINVSTIIRIKRGREVESGCSVIYTETKITTLRRDSCSDFISEEMEKGRLNGLCWKRNYQILSLRSYKDWGEGCIVEYGYKKNCLAEVIQNKCDLIIGDGSENKLNIVLVTYGFTEKNLIYFPFYVEDTIKWFKIIEPFSSNTDKYNVYVIASADNLCDPLIQEELIKNKEGLPLCEYDSEREVHRYVAKNCLGIIRKDIDIVYLIVAPGLGIISSYDVQGLSGTPCRYSIRDTPYNFYSKSRGSIGCPKTPISRAGRTVIHEIGHDLGLNHDFSSPNIMGGDRDRGGSIFLDYQKEIILNELNNYKNR